MLYLRLFHSAAQVGLKFIVILLFQLHKYWNSKYVPPYLDIYPLSFSLSRVCVSVLSLCVSVSLCLSFSIL